MFQAKHEIQPKKASTKTDKLGQFLSMDGKVLCFTGYWDDRATCDGELHLLKVLYYLADDTIEVKDVTWKDQHYTLYKKAKLPKVWFYCKYEYLYQLITAVPSYLLLNKQKICWL